MAPLPSAWHARSIERVYDSGRSVFASVHLDTGWMAAAFDGTAWRELARTTDPGESVMAWPGRRDEVWTAFMTRFGFRLALQSGTCCRRTLDRIKAFSGRLNAVEPLPDGGFWLGTSLGLVRKAPEAWRSPPELAGLDGWIGAMREASTGILYALHERGLLQRASAGWELHRVPEGYIVDPGPTMNLAELADGRIVFGAGLAAASGDATLAFDPVRAAFAPIRHPDGRSVRMLGPAAHGAAWVVTRAGGDYRLERYDGERFTAVVDVEAAWRSGVPRTILELAGGDLLVTPDGSGVGFVRQGRRHVIGQAEGYPGAGAFTALEIAPGRFWLGDRDSIIAFDGTRWTTLRSGLQTVRAIVRTRDGSVWVTSGSGLHRFRDGTWSTVAAADGLPDGGAHHLLEDRSGTLWVSTTAGLASYAAEADPDPPQTILGPENPTEAPPSGDVRIAFSGRDRWNYSSANRLLYSWRRDGGAWSNPEPDDAVRFEGLSAGRHRLEVRAADRNWNLDPSPATLDFVVLHPWYAAPGFIAVGLLAATALLTTVVLFVSRHVRLERLVGQRTTALAEANAQLRAELADRQRVEGERAMLERQLHQGQKLEAVGRLAGGIVHDFNNLLTVITGFADCVRDDVPDNPAAIASVDEIARAADRAAALTRQLMAFTQQQFIEPKPLDLNQLIADVERMLRRLIGEDIVLSFAPGVDLWPVLADRGQLDQVIVNLAVNARDAMPAGGQLTMQTANVVLDEDFVRGHAGTRPGPHVRLRVSDTGIGMDADTQSRIFDPFFTTKGRDKGSGLGLATVYGIVSQAGGHIWVESEPGRGTTFSIYVPRTDLVAHEEARAVGPESPRGSERLLIVEDDDAVRRVACSILAQLGYAVEALSSAEAALERLRDGADPPELLLTDIVLTGVSGPELAARARALQAGRAGLRVLFMSGYVDIAVVGDGLPSGAHFIQKPFTAAGLGRRVREVLDAPA